MKNEASKENERGPIRNVDLIVPKNELSSGSSVNRRQFPQPAQHPLSDPFSAKQIETHCFAM